LVLGWTQAQIAAALNVSQPTISQDVQFLQGESAKALSDVVEKALPFQFEKCMRTVEETSRRLLQRLGANCHCTHS
jgi:predicted transcriptional regulator